MAYSTTTYVDFHSHTVDVPWWVAAGFGCLIVLVTAVCLLVVRRRRERPPPLPPYRL